MGEGQKYMSYTSIGKRQMSNTFFESGGKCPPLLIIRGADVHINHFSQGANVRGGQMSYSQKHGEVLN